MSKAAMNLQDSFLNQVRRENTEVKVLLVNGTGLRGVVKGFDNFTVILQNRNGQHLIYKHAIAQLVNQRQGGIKREGDDILGAEGTGIEESATEANATPVPEATNPPKRRDDQGHGRRDEQGHGQGRREGSGSRREQSGQSRREDQGQGRREEANQARRDDQNKPEEKTRKDGFNRLDLSAVRLASESEEKVESK